MESGSNASTVYNLVGYIHVLAVHKIVHPQVHQAMAQLLAKSKTGTIVS